MDTPLCGISAFRFYRIPPHVLACLPECIPGGLYERHGIVSNAVIRALIGNEISLAAFSRGQRYANKHIVWELYSRELPFGSVLDTHIGLPVLSPCATCLSLARSLPLPHLVLALYEMCGYYSEWKMPECLGFPSETDGGLSSSMRLPGNWKCVHNSTGKPTSLWQRPPLTTIEELHGYAERAAHMRGASKLRRALKLVCGVTASPFESKTAVLLTFPLELGGQGFTGFQCNYPITLSSDARSMAYQKRCYIDLYNQSSVTQPPIAIECQGRIVHDDSYSGIKDADRTLGLKRMGIEVLPVTYKQLYEPSSYKAFCSLIADKLDQPFVNKDARLMRAETELRYAVLKEFTALMAGEHKVQ